MQQIEQNGYTRQEVVDQLTFINGERELSFRYELLDKNNMLKDDLGNVLSGNVAQSYLSDIKRTAQFTIEDDGSINYLSDRIRPWARITMPGDTRPYSKITRVDDAPVDNGGVLDHHIDNMIASYSMDDSGDDLRRNLCSNPSFAYNANDWMSYGDCDISQHNTGIDDHDQLLKIEKNATSTQASGARFKATVGQDGFTKDSSFIFSLWLYVPDGQTTDSASITVNGSGEATWSQFELHITPGEWVRLHGIMTTKESGTLNFNVKLPNSADNGDYIYVDDVLIEPSDDLGDYFDGDSGWGYEWDGTAGNSQSRRMPRAKDLISGEHAIVGDDVTEGAPSIVHGSSFYFPGKPTSTSTDKVLTLPDDAFMDRHGAISIVCWVSVVGSFVTNDILSQPDEPAYNLHLGTDTNKDITFHIGTKSHDSVALGGTATNPFDLEAKMITVVFQSGTKPKVYVNDQEQTVTLDATDNQYNSSPVLNLNGKPIRIGDGFNGWLDELAFFKIALSEDQINELWRAGNRLGPFNDNHHYAEWPQGVFLLSTPSRSSDDNGAVTRNVDGYDQLQVYSDDKITDRFTVDEGDNYIDVIMNGKGGVTLLDMPTDQIVFRSSSSTLPAAKDYDPGTTKLAIINDLLSAVNYNSLYFDEFGNAVLSKYVRPSKRTAEYTYVDDDKSVLLPAMEQTLDLFSIPNQWVLVVSNADQESLSATFTNDSPLSPTSTVNRGRTIVDYLTEQDAPDQTTLEDRAENMADQASQVYEKVSMTTAIMPFHSNNDILALRYSTLAIADKYSETKWSFDLDPQATMTHEIRRQVQI
jgi:hypothetical protein